MGKNHVKLSEKDREYLEELIRKGKQKAKAFRRAMGLLELDRGKTVVEVAKICGVSRPTVMGWRDRYQELGLRCLEDAPRSGRPIQIDGKQRAKITALACSEAPAGYARWSLRLLSDKVVELGYAKGISHTQVGSILKKTNLNRISSKRGV
jgi:putative transposase